jgi:hypothetical protein
MVMDKVSNSSRFPAQFLKVLSHSMFGPGWAFLCMQPLAWQQWGTSSTRHEGHYHWEALRECDLVHRNMAHDVNVQKQWGRSALHKLNTNLHRSVILSTWQHDASFRSIHLIGKADKNTNKIKTLYLKLPILHVETQIRVVTPIIADCSEWFL